MIYIKANLGLGPDVAIWPPPRGILSPDWMFQPKEEWTREQWQEYAEMLERQGHSLVSMLEEAKAEAAGLRAKLGRRKDSPELSASLLGYLEQMELRRKRGRPKAAQKKTQTVLMAERALIVQAEMQEASGRARVPNTEALEELLRRDGGRRKVADHRAVLNAMSKIGNHKKSPT
ncbi:hypothetical protein WKW77_19965 [Variovorax ureilyticus]|uniref:Uncharacterized protein n=1 Tax=Variovorax ureilyticus TaxID=1836198 RepID=A0ABU8VI84_9BURK